MLSDSIAISHDNKSCSSATAVSAPAALTACALTAQIPPNGGNRALSGERAASEQLLLSLFIVKSDIPGWPQGSSKASRFQW